MPRAAAKRQGSPGQSRPHLPLVRRQLLLDAPAAHGSRGASPGRRQRPGGDVAYYFKYSGITIHQRERSDGLALC